VSGRVSGRVRVATGGSVGGRDPWARVWRSAPGWSAGGGCRRRAAWGAWGVGMSVCGLLIFVVIASTDGRGRGMGGAVRGPWGAGPLRGLDAVGASRDGRGDWR